MRSRVRWLAPPGPAGFRPEPGPCSVRSSYRAIRRIRFKEQSELVDSIAERIQSLGGVSIAMPHDVAETTLIPRPPRGREDVPAQLSRLLHAQEIVLKEARAMARQAAEAGDDGTNDLLVSDVIRTNEMQVWFVGEHLVNTPLARHE
jgi:starvation-inducible DNA-binding protein